MAVEDWELLTTQFPMKWKANEIENGSNRIIKVKLRLENICEKKKYIYIHIYIQEMERGQAEAFMSKISVGNQTDNVISR